jgi:hypothetical protein
MHVAPVPGGHPLRVALVVGVVVAIALAGLGAVELYRLGTPSSVGPGPITVPGGTVDVADLTPQLGATFHPGAIQGFGTNATTILYAGISVWNRPQELSWPELDRQLSGGAIENLTPQVEASFHEGGVFGTVWNGSSWLISGESTWGNDSGGVLLSLEGGRWSNLTPLVRPYFRDGGVWAVGWNGSSWLLAGNSSGGSTLVSYRLGHLQDLTAVLPANRPGGWIQLLVWNGSSWMVGGKGAFGLLQGGRYTDLRTGTPFAGSGVFGADWNGTAWVVGGGPPAAIAIVRGSSVLASPALGPAFDAWVNSVVWTPSGWLLAGKGFAGASGGSTPQLALWSGSSSATATDLSAYLPASFARGQVQFAAWAPPLGSRVLLLVGQGALDSSSGYSEGALASMTWVAAALN